MYMYIYIYSHINIGGRPVRVARAIGPQKLDSLLRMQETHVSLCLGRPGGPGRAPCRRLSRNACFTQENEQNIK